ncbi:MAG: Threonine/homoserine efflux transporter RhtA [Acidimicrobiales bacterium]|nr:Threonine/homoserine efflux transporter RhtA [Acidimicrobiales bacterium]
MTPPDARRSVERRATAALVLAGFLFGSTFLVVKDAVERAAVLPFLSSRFLIGGLVLLPVALRRPPSRDEVRHGILAGLCLLAGYVLQTIGLQWTTSSSSAFITYLLVVLVPVMTSLSTRTLPERSLAAAVGLALVGLFLLSGGLKGFGRGEVLTLLCAVAFALHIVVLGRTAARHDAVRLTCWQVLTVGVACLVPGALDGGYRFDASVWGAVAFLGVGATAAAFLCMVWGQRSVGESRAAIILLIEPVAAAILGYAAGDRLGWRGTAGAAVILVAVLVAELGPRRPPAIGGELAALRGALDAADGAGDRRDP